MPPQTIRLTAWSCTTFQHASWGLTWRPRGCLGIGANGEGKSNLLEGRRAAGSLCAPIAPQRFKDLSATVTRPPFRASCGDDQLELSCGEGEDGRRAAMQVTLECATTTDRPAAGGGFGALDLDLVPREPALRASGWIGWCCSLSPSTASCCGATGRCCVSAASFAAPRHRPLGSKAPARRLRPTNGPGGTRLHRRPAAPRPACKPVGRRLQERLSAGRERLELGYQAVSRLEGEGGGGGPGATPG